MKLIVTFIPSGFVKFYQFVFMLHLLTYIILSIKGMNSNIFETSERKKKRENKQEGAGTWYDVQDENGIWRVGLCERKEPLYKVISLDGYHPSHTSVLLK